MTWLRWVQISHNDKLELWIQELMLAVSSVRVMGEIRAPFGITLRVSKPRSIIVCSMTGVLFMFLGLPTSRCMPCCLRAESSMRAMRPGAESI